MPPINANLALDLAKKRVVLFLGSGVSASAKTRTRSKVKQWEAFLRFCAKKLKGKAKAKLVEQYIDNRDFLMASEIIKLNLSADEWEKILVSEFGQIATPSALHKAIVALDQRLLITTNFDLILENAWHQYNSTATHAPQIITDISASIFKILRDDEYHIIKLHGSINEPKRLILSKSDYIKYAYGSWIYTTLFETLLLTHTFLFIGFSMNDPAISHLIEMYSYKYPDARPHYMFTSEKVEPQIADISKQLRKIVLLNYSSASNHRELVKQLNDLSKDAKRRRKELLLS